MNQKSLDDELSAENIKKILCEAIDKTQVEWEMNLISGSRPAHIYTSIILEAGSWYGKYIASLKSAVEHMKELSVQNKMEIFDGQETK